MMNFANSGPPVGNGTSAEELARRAEQGQIDAEIRVSVVEREWLADERDRRADERDRRADVRDGHADERDRRADQRDRHADERDRRADQREIDDEMRASGESR